MQRVAIAGAGATGLAHAELLASIDAAELVAICDIGVVAAEECANRYGARAFSRAKEMIEEAEFDVLDICTPTSTHIELIKAAAAARKNVIVEAPMARTSVEAQEAIRLCSEAKITLFPVQSRRWSPEYKKLHDLVASGAVGEPVIARLSHETTHPSGWDDWYADYRRSGGVVLGQLIHDFDWLRWCFGKARKVNARGLYDRGIHFVDHALVTLRFDNGVIAHVEGSWAKPCNSECSVEVAGNSGLLSFDSSSSAPLRFELRTVENSGCSEIVSESLLATSPLSGALEHIIGCLEEGRVPDVRPEDGYEAVRIGEAALRSITTGQPVVLT